MSNATLKTFDPIGFTKAVLRSDPFDGGELQDMGVAYGVLVPTEVTEACGETCECAEVDDFPQTCYRWAKELLRDDSGVSLIEFGLLVTLICIVALTAVALLGTNLSTLYCHVAFKIWAGTTPFPCGKP